MKYFLIVIIFFLMQLSGKSQDSYKQAYSGKKGSFYFYWGWNRARYTQSDIQFEGTSYNFSLDQVRSKDRFSKLSFRTYLNPAFITIPQYNFKIGFYLTDQYSISLGNDHMKYIVQKDQLVKISGKIENSGTKYDGIYRNDDLYLTEDFLKFEHSDGLNYFNLDFRRADNFLDFKRVKLNFVEGIGGGVVITKTDSKLLNNDRHDAFHVSGYGANVLLGLNIEIFKYFFIQAEEKFGFINLPDIRTTQFKLDKANQAFFFYQFNISFGAVFRFRKPDGFLSKLSADIY